MVNKDEFELDEEKALKEAFEEAREKRKLFNIDSWKLKREKLRSKFKLSTSND